MRHVQPHPFTTDSHNPSRGVARRPCWTCLFPPQLPLRSPSSFSLSPLKPLCRPEMWGGVVGVAWGGVGVGMVACFSGPVEGRGEARRVGALPSSMAHLRSGEGGRIKRKERCSVTYEGSKSMFGGSPPKKTPVCIFPFFFVSLSAERGKKKNWKGWWVG